VVGAAILRDGRCLVAQRGPGMALPLQWEFAGGKVEDNEDPREALRREIREELGLEVEVGELLNRGHALQKEREIVLDVYVATITGGALALAEHAGTRWVGAEEIYALDWAAADVPVLAALETRLREEASAISGGRGQAPPLHPEPRPDFSPLAASYARSRPRYPPALYAWLASLVDRHDLAWDCATGNGQAAHGLAEHFSRVVATDVSAEQIRHAPPHPRIEYRAARAEHSGLDDASVDVATIAAALHWVDLEPYAAEARRVIRPGGVLVAWSYHTAEIDPPFDRAFARLYWDHLKPWFAAATDHVDRHYEDLPLPGRMIAAPPFAIEVEWTLAQVEGYIRTWSGAHAYQTATGRDPAELVHDELQAIFGGDATRTLPLRIPLFVRARRL